MEICRAINPAVNMPAHIPLNRPASPLHYLASLVFIQMATSRKNSPGCHAFCSHSPVRSACPAKCADPSVHTHTGRRCNILGCLEILPGLHFTHSCFCSPSACLNSHSAGLLWPSSISVYNPCFQKSWLHSEEMPRLRHRMRCRRSASRGRPPCPGSSIIPTSGSFAEDDCHGLHFASRKQSRHSLFAGGSSFASPELNPPPIPPPSTSPVLHETANPTLRQTTQRAKFHFNYTFDKHVLNVVITTSVCQSPAGLNPVTVPLSVNIPPRPLPPGVDSDVFEPNEPQGIGKPISESNKEQEGFNCKDIGPLQDNAEKEEEFRCRIVEEPEHPFPTQ